MQPDCEMVKAIVALAAEKLDSPNAEFISPNIIKNVNIEYLIDWLTGYYSDEINRWVISVIDLNTFQVVIKEL